MNIRTFGTIISGNRGRDDELSIEQRIATTALRAVGKTSTEIAEIMSCSRQTVIRTVRRFTERNNLSSRPRSGHPRALSDRDKAHVLRVVRQELRITYRDIIQQAELSYHRRVVYNLIKEAGITNWRAKKRPLLTDDNARIRLAFAHSHVNWSAAEWARVIFVDECLYERGKGKKSV